MRPPNAGSVTARAKRVSTSPYTTADISQTSSTPKQHTNVIYYIVIAFVAAVVFLYVRARGSYGGTPVKTGPVLTLVPPESPDQAQIENLTNAINALAGQVHKQSPIPGGGASTPIAVLLGSNGA